MSQDWAWLTATAAEYLNRADGVAAVPKLITLAESQLMRRLTQANVPGGFTTLVEAVSTQTVAAPADLASLMGVTIFDPAQQLWVPLETVTPFSGEVLAAQREAVPAIPDRVALEGGNLWFSPAPDKSYQVTIYYIGRFVGLSASTPTNWVLTNYPDVYLYGVLSQAAGYFPDMALDGRIATWKASYDEACLEVVEAERRKRGPLFTPAFRASDTPPNFGRRRFSFNIQTGL